jgi:FAD/FMN-containing dehydrogenase
LGGELLAGKLRLAFLPEGTDAFLTDFLPVLTEKLDPGYRDLTRRIKTMLDPNGIMNAFSWR